MNIKTFIRGCLCNAQSFRAAALMTPKQTMSLCFYPGENYLRVRFDYMNPDCNTVRCSCSYYWQVIVWTALLAHHCLIFWIVTKWNELFRKRITGDKNQKSHHKDCGKSNPLCAPGSRLPQDLQRCPKVRAVQSPICLLCYIAKPPLLESVAMSCHTFQGGCFSVCRPREQNPLQLWWQQSEWASVEPVSGQSSVTANQHVLQFDTLRDTSCCCLPVQILIKETSVWTDFAAVVQSYTRSCAQEAASNSFLGPIQFKTIQTLVHDNMQKMNYGVLFTP